ncbi:MAG: hypothetical protein IKD89_03820 [Clostridia bacterium]|nr:hypothetical protein [Clostridia bacterium]
MTYLTAVYGDDADDALFSALLRLAEASGFSYAASDARGRLYRRAGAADVFFSETRGPCALSCGADILILKRSARTMPRGRFGYIILSDECAPYIGKHADAGTVITCGINQKSSVSVSSNAEAGVLMFIQRRIVSLSGETLEPQELCVPTREGTHGYDAMAAVICCLILGGEYEKIKNIRI